MQQNKKDHSRIFKLYQKNKSFAKTGRIVNLSKQRIHQIITGYITFYNYKSPWRKKLMQKKSCLVCHKNKPVLLHKADFSNRNNKRDNLTPVCQKCHNKLHNEHHRKTHYFRSQYLKCKTCQKPFGYKFHSAGHSYCEKCYRHIKTGFKAKVPCLGCKTIFNRKNLHGGRQYCPKCKTIIQKGRDPKITQICSFCQKPFHPFRSALCQSPHQTFHFDKFSCQKKFLSQTPHSFFTKKISPLTKKNKSSKV